MQLDSATRRAIDVLVYEQSVFERCASRRNSFESVIKNEGVIL